MKFTDEPRALLPLAHISKNKTIESKLAMTLYYGYINKVDEHNSSLISRLPRKTPDSQRIAALTEAAGADH